jgi:hypothetical protein
MSELIDDDHENDHDDDDVHRVTAPAPTMIVKEVNIYKNPILAAFSSERELVFLFLSNETTSSLITKHMADKLNLQIYPTTHNTTQANEVTDLKVLGEVHTTFYKGASKLSFSAHK